jgi:hypothetical protein
LYLSSSTDRGILFFLRCHLLPEAALFANGEFPGAATHSCIQHFRHFVIFGIWTIWFGRADYLIPNYGSVYGSQETGGSGPSGTRNFKKSRTKKRRILRLGAPLFQTVTSMDLWEIKFLVPRPPYHTPLKTVPNSSVSMKQFTRHPSPPFTAQIANAPAAVWWEQMPPKRTLNSKLCL